MRFVTLLMLVSTPLTSLACGGPEPDPAATDAISRERFIEAYFELRKVGLRSRGMDITLDSRDSVLAELGLTEADLLTFVDVWGDDGEMMISVWEEVDSLMMESRRAQGEVGEGVYGSSAEDGGRNDDGRDGRREEPS
ncbi:MAG: hypothetical protein HKO65_01755 [Gemmatimonadetes bacterium]|nr:hypothetical protein [Gemmatimonadota bacterium]NNM03800.1 hypothetical protein [Gemmatimonadota bacterium]